MKAEYSFGVVILAAGASSRMGQPKLLLPWAGTTILGHIANQWQALRATQVVPVFRPGASDLEVEWARLGYRAQERIINEEVENGMFSSIKAAALWCRWNSNITHFVITLGDQPQIAAKTLKALIEFSREHPCAIVQPSVKGRPKHPVIVPANVFLRICSTNAITLREFLEEHGGARCFMDSSDPGLDFDIDTPEEYAVACQRFAAVLGENA